MASPSGSLPPASQDMAVIATSQKTANSLTQQGAAPAKEERPITTFEQHMNRASEAVQSMAQALQTYKAADKLEGEVSKLKKACTECLNTANAVQSSAAAAAQKIAALKAKYAKKPAENN